MNDMGHTPKGGTKLDELTIASNFGDKSLSAPRARTPAGGLPPHKGYWQDPVTGQQFSGGMEIAPAPWLK